MHVTETIPPQLTLLNQITVDVRDAYQTILQKEEAQQTKSFAFKLSINKYHHRLICLYNFTHFFPHETELNRQQTITL